MQCLISRISAPQPPPAPGSTWILFAREPRRRKAVRVLEISGGGRQREVVYEKLLPTPEKQTGSIPLRDWQRLRRNGQVRESPNRAGA